MAVLAAVAILLPIGVYLCCGAEASPPRRTDAAKVIQLPWLKSALPMGAELTEEVGAAYVKTARQALR